MPDSDADENPPGSATPNPNKAEVDELENDGTSASGDSEPKAGGDTGEKDKSMPPGDTEPKADDGPQEADAAAEEAREDTRGSASGGVDEVGEDSAPPAAPSNNNNNDTNEGADVDNEDGSDEEQEKFPQQLWDLVESETREGGMNAACGNRVIEWLPEGE